jgi:peptidoglycan/xylan/chitin deacetylase (PgdA/CDA1 family)
MAGLEPAFLVGVGHSALRHTRTHSRLSELDGDRQYQGIAGSADDFTEIMETRPVSFAYPFRDMGDRAAAIARSEHELAVGIAEGVADLGADPWRLPRFMIWPQDRAVDLMAVLLLGHNVRRALGRTQLVRSIKRSSGPRA